MKTFYSDGKEPSDAEAREARAAREATRRREVAEIRAALAGLEADLLQLIGSKLKSLGVDGLDVVSSHICIIKGAPDRVLKSDVDSIEPGYRPSG